MIKTAKEAGVASSHPSRKRAGNGGRSEVRVTNHAGDLARGSSGRCMRNRERTTVIGREGSSAWSEMCPLQ